MDVTKIILEGNNLILKSATDKVLFVIASSNVNLSVFSGDASHFYLTSIVSGREPIDFKLLLDASKITVPAPPVGGWNQTNILQYFSDNLVNKDITVTSILQKPNWTAPVKLTVTDTGLIEIPKNLNRKSLRISNDNSNDCWFSLGDFLPIINEDIVLKKKTSIIFNVSEIGTQKIRFITKANRTTLITYQEGN